MRQQFFIKPAIQIKYFAITLLIVLLTTGLIYYVVQHKITRSEFIEGVTTHEVEMLKSEIKRTVIPITIILLIATGLQSLLLFHRLLGPLYVFERILKLIGEGNIGGHIHLRKHDELKDIANEIEAMSSKLVKFVREDRERITEIQAGLSRMKEKAPQLSDEIKKLEETLTAITGNFKLPNPK